LDPFGQEGLHEGLVGHVPFVGQQLQLFEHELGQAEGDGGQAGGMMAEESQNLTCLLLSPR
jgi:hypothetical protein